MRKLREDSKKARASVKEETPTLLRTTRECREITIEPIFEKKLFKKEADPIARRLHELALAYHPALAAEVDHRANSAALVPVMKYKSPEVELRTPLMRAPDLGNPKKSRFFDFGDHAPKLSPEHAEGPKLPALWRKCMKPLDGVKEIDEAVSARKARSVWDAIDSLMDWIAGSDPKLLRIFTVTSDPPRASFMLRAGKDFRQPGQTKRKFENMARGYYRLHVEFPGRLPADIEFSLVTTSSDRVHCQLEPPTDGGAPSGCTLE